MRCSCSVVSVSGKKWVFLPTFCVYLCGLILTLLLPKLLLTSGQCLSSKRGPSIYWRSRLSAVNATTDCLFRWCFIRLYFLVTSTTTLLLNAFVRECAAIRRYIAAVKFFRLSGVNQNGIETGRCRSINRCSTQIEKIKRKTSPLRLIAADAKVRSSIRPEPLA